MKTTESSLPPPVMKKTQKTNRISLPREIGESQVRQAYTRIEEMIVTLQLRPGQLVSENMLASMLNFGRTPVREALQQLVREGLVVILGQRGIVISEIDVRKQLRLLEVRRHIERCVVELAVRRATENERAQLAELASKMDDVMLNNDGIAFLELDSELNQLLLTASRNEYAAASMKLTQGLSRRFWFAHYTTAADLPETVRLHANIARAVSDRNLSESLQALDCLLDNVEAFTRATLDIPPCQDSCPVI